MGFTGSPFTSRLIRRGGHCSVKFRPVAVTASPGSAEATESRTVAGACCRVLGGVETVVPWPPAVPDFADDVVGEV
jgi:hypothetical protein